MMDIHRADRIFSAVPGFVFALLLVLCAVPLSAQTAPSPLPQPPAPSSTQRPGDVYKELTRPLDEVRRSLDNWSAPELAALAAGIKQAQQYCGQVAPASVTDDDLYQLARVCSFGRQWNAADAAASAYITSPSQRYKAQAYAIRVNALLNLKDTTMAVEVARSMLHSVPYDATVDQSMSYLIQYLAMSLDAAALSLARERQPALLEALPTPGGLKEQSGDAVISTAALYGEGLELAYLDRYAGRDNEAQQAVSQIDGALAKGSADTDEQAAIAQAKARYKLLGEKLPPIDILPYKTSFDPRPHIHPNDGSTTVLFPFPAWCSQCAKMMQPLTEFGRRNGAKEMRAYGLLALEPDQAGTDPFHGEQFGQQFQDLLHTATLATTASALQMLGADSFPFAVIVDGGGRIRFVGQIPANAFDAGGYVEQFIEKNILKSASPDAPAAVVPQGTTRP